MTDERAARNAKVRQVLSQLIVNPALIAIAFLAIAVALLWAGTISLVQRETGARMQVKVDDCDVKWQGQYRYVYCTGTWIVGGPLSENGHVVVGSVEGADTDDVGKMIDVTLSPDGETAYTRDVRVPVILLATGAGFVVLFLWWLRLMLLARAAPAP